MYFGSVRFFKHIILTGLVLSILVPVSLCITFSVQKRQLQTELAQAASLLEAQDPPEARQDQSAPEAPAYQLLYPDLYCTPRPEAAAVEKTAYLTFDDGPTPVTDTVLDALSQKNVKATFFVIGQQLDTPENQERLRRIASDGHTLGIHTHTHDYLKIYDCVEAYLDDFYAAWSRVRELTGFSCEIFRFPGGSINTYNQGIYQEIIAEMLRRGFAYFDWNLSAQDAVTGKSATAASIVRSVSHAGQQSRVILLMHDSKNKATTAEAVPGIIDSLIGQGFSLEPLNRTVLPVAFGYIR